MHKKVIIVGGGPSGLMAAYQLQKHNIDYLLIERNPLLGKKFLITGSGRCNITNHLNTGQFIKQLTLKHSKFLYSSLSQFSTSDIVEFFKDNSVPLYQDGDLKYFPKSNKAKDLVDVFENYIKGNYNTNETVLEISKDEVFHIKTTRHTFTSDFVIISTGSKSYPKTGSKGDGLLFAKAFGIETRDFYPAETSVYSTFAKKNKEYLQGITIKNATVRIEGTKIKNKGDLLFTHFGLSGPSIFHMSEFIYHNMKEGKEKLLVSFCDKNDNEIEELFDQSKDLYVLKLLEKLTIKRIAKFLLVNRLIENKKISELSKSDLNKLKEDLLRFVIKIDKVEEVKNAFVNGGGVLTKELSPKSFESKKVQGLYFVGETVDLHGPIGGFNMTIALSSGFSAAIHVKGNIF